MPVPVDPNGREGEGGGGRGGGGRSKKKTRHSRASHLDVNTHLLEAIVQSKLRVVRRLLESGADPNYQGGNNHTTPLMLASGLGEEGVGEAVCSLLLHKGANVNLQDTLGKTALMYAVLSGQQVVVEQLLGCGADVGLVDQEGNIALSYAAMSQQEGCEVYVHQLVRAGLDRRVSVDHQNLRGLTPLLIAAQGGNVEVAHVLVEAGASLSKRDLDHFMNAEDWMKQAGCYTEHELEFLSPSGKKRNFYRQERLKKGIRTLSDYLPSSDSDGSAESPNVFTVQRSDRHHHTKAEHSGFVFPSIHTASETPEEATASSSHRSMFDILSKKTHEPTRHSLMEKAEKKGPSFHFSSVANVKMDLYKSPYLSKRQSLLLRNSKSEGYHVGALAPISSTTTSSHLQPSSSKKGGGAQLNSKNPKLPPIIMKK